MEPDYDEDKPQANDAPAPSAKARILAASTSIILPVVILLTGAFATIHLLETGPEAEKRDRPRRAQLVEVIQVHSRAEHVVAHAVGSVIPARQVTLQSRVSGEVLEVDKNFVPGAVVTTDTDLVILDPEDYNLLVTRAENRIAQLNADLRIEQGNQEIARREYELLGEEIPEEERDLILRTPQLTKLQRSIDEAHVELDEANLMLKRSTIKAPFDATIVERFVDVGSQVSAGERLVTLLGTDEYWVEVAVPLSTIPWLKTPSSEGEGGSKVYLTLSTGTQDTERRIGKVIRILQELSEQGQMAKVLVSIADPLAQKPENQGVPPLYISTFVNVEIIGTMLNSVVALDRSLLRDGNRVWVMSDDGKLDMRDVVIAYRSKEHVLVKSGLNDGDLVVSTRLTTAVNGMPIRINQPSGTQSSEEMPKDAHANTTGQ